MSLWERKKIVVIVMIVVLGVIISWGIDASWTKEKVPVVEKLVNPDEFKEETVLANIYISGAVVRPGIYQVPRGTRVQEAVKSANGFCPQAAIHKVNLVKKCKDGMHIYVPWLPELKSAQPLRNTIASKRVNKKWEKSAPTRTRKKSSLPREKISKQQNFGKINLNTATVEELMTLPEIGFATARAIIEYRKWHRFYAVWEVKKVPGISQAKYRKLAPLLEV